MSLKRMLLLLSPIILFIVSTNSADCQQVPVEHTISKTQRKLLHQLAKHGRVEAARIGYAAMYSEQYARFDSLRKISSLEQVTYFAQLPSPAVKIYFYNELIRSHRLWEAYQILQKNTHNQNYIEVQVGCSVMPGIVSRVMYFKLKLALHSTSTILFENQEQILRAMQEELPTHRVEEQIIARHENDF